MTNADKIRNMTDEELAEAVFLYDDYFDCKMCDAYTRSGCGVTGKECLENIIKWLKSEVST